MASSQSESERAFGVLAGWPKCCKCRRYYEQWWQEGSDSIHRWLRSQSECWPCVYENVKKWASDNRIIEGQCSYLEEIVRLRPNDL